MSERCTGTGMRTWRPANYREPDLCPICRRVAYVRVDGTTGSHRAPQSPAAAVQPTTGTPTTPSTDDEPQRAEEGTE